jgi:Fic-DOC domain mobile mystery protein B
VAITGAHAPGATPLSEDDIRGLKLPLATFAELNEAEAANILRGQEWALRSRKTNVPEMFSDEYILMLHQKMYGDVWSWAGEVRPHNFDISIGVPHYSIRAELKRLRDDVDFWIKNGTYPAEEVAIRAHHRLVWIHPFRNGNGRLSRLFADLLLLKHFGLTRLPWGGGIPSAASTQRDTYNAALHDADLGDFTALLPFCKATVWPPP